MNVIGINASPRKNANTQTLVEAVLAGDEYQKNFQNLNILRQLQQQKNYVKLSIVVTV